MSDAAQAGSEAEESALSLRWIRSVVIVMAVGFAGLITITSVERSEPAPRRRAAGDSRNQRLHRRAHDTKRCMTLPRLPGLVEE